MNNFFARLCTGGFLCASIQSLIAIKPWFECKPSYFFFSNAPLKYIYNNGGFELQASVTVPFCQNGAFYGSIGGRKSWGHALSTKEKTSLSVVPVDIGLKAIVNGCRGIYCFAAIGPRYFYFHQNNKSSYVSASVHGNGLGFFVNTGFNVLFKDHFIVGLFGEYSYEQKTICSEMVNVYSNGPTQLGGFAFGVSLGYEF